MSAINNITVGNPKKLLRPVIFSMLANFASVLPFVFAIYAIKTIFLAFSQPEVPLNETALWGSCIALLFSMVIIFIAERPAYRSCFREAYSMSAKGRTDLAEHLRKLPLGYLYKRDPGDLANMLMGDFALLEHGFSHFAPQLIGALIMPILAFIGLAFLDWKMALAMLSVLPIALIIFIGATKVLRHLGQRHMKAKINAGNRLQEYLNGIRVIKAYNMTGSRFERLEKSFKELMRESIRLEGWVGPFVMLAIACMRAGLTIMILLGVYLLTKGELSLITFVTFLIVGARVFDPLTLALVNFAELRYSEQAGERILSLYQEPIMAGDKSPTEKCNINFNDVTFGYGSNNVLKNISVQMESGSLTALVGPSGSGKSTMLKLIARFYDPSSGKVLLGGHDMREMQPKAIFGKISMVFQDVYLFQDTILNNIRFGKENATDEEVYEAAKLACCHDFISKLPGGYNTQVGEGGCTLSGGEKQRISIARAFLKNAPIVLLDEATASLDPENEQDVQRAIAGLIKGRTVIVVAHRLKTVCNADKIYVLNEGKIAESGTHDSLIREGGLYAKLWGLQKQSHGWVLG